MVHQSPTRSKARATGHCIPPKLLCCMTALTCNFHHESNYYHASRQARVKKMAGAKPAIYENNPIRR
jgi:hypothetical protein